MVLRRLLAWLRKYQLRNSIPFLVLEAMFFLQVLVILVMEEAVGIHLLLNLSLRVLVKKVCPVLLQLVHLNSHIMKLPRLGTYIMIMNLLFNLVNLLVEVHQKQVLKQLLNRRLSTRHRLIKIRIVRQNILL